MDKISEMKITGVKVPGLVPAMICGDYLSILTDHWQIPRTKVTTRGRTAYQFLEEALKRAPAADVLAAVDGINFDAVDEVEGKEEDLETIIDIFQWDTEAMQVSDLMET